ncbi:hypothetical protein KUCAC02_002334, partial [Chaenocephalus aceratus]
LPGDLPLHCTVMWLSKGKVLSRFFELLDAVKLFMEQKDKDYPELSDPKWIMDLAFLVDMLCHLDRLNLDLQGKLKMLPDLENFATRFHDLHAKRPQITFLVDPFNAETDCLKAPLVKDEAVAELEMIELSEDDRQGPLSSGKLGRSKNTQIKECQKSH